MTAVSRQARVPLPAAMQRGSATAHEALLRRTVELASRRYERVLSDADEAKVEAARKDPVAFCEYVLKDPRTKERLAVQPFQREWFAHVQANPRAYIECPRDHGKTSLVTIGYVLWRIGTDPSLRVKIVCQSDNTAKKRLQVIKDYIDADEDLHRVFPNLRKHPRARDWGAFSITVDRSGKDKDPTVEACGITSAGTGGRADLILADDVVDERNAISQPRLRATVKENWFNVWTNLLDPPSDQVVFVCTPWHQADLTQEVKKGGTYKVLSQSIDEVFTPLWPSKWSREKLQERLKEIGRRRFDRAFRNLVHSDEELLFPPGVMERSISRSKSLADLPHNLRFYVGVDLAISKANDAAWTVIFVAAVDEDGFRYPVRIVRRKMGSVATAAWLLAITGQYDPEIVKVENNQYQAALIEWTEVFRTSGIAERASTPGATSPVNDITDREWAWMWPLLARARANPPRIQPIFTGGQKADADVGLPALASEFEGGLWRIYLGGTDHDADCTCTTCTWVGEMATYPAGRFRDTVMACWFTQTAMRAGAGKIDMWFPDTGADPVVPTPEAALLMQLGVDPNRDVAPTDTCGACSAFNASTFACARRHFTVEARMPACDQFDDAREVAA